MKIAIVGGGAAGMICAHYLCKNHDVTVYEKRSSLGGNIRTLNGNVPCSNIPSDVRIEAGVTAFNFAASPTLRKLFKELDVPFYLSPPKLATSISLRNRQQYIVPSFRTWLDHGPKYFFQTCKVHKLLFPDMIKMLWRLTLFSDSKLRDMPMSNVIHRTSLLSQKWMRCSIMLGLSMPYSETAFFPSDWLKQIFFGYRLPFWVTPKYGMYHYIEKIIEKNKKKLSILCNVDIKFVERKTVGGVIHLRDGGKHPFDKIIFACPPFEILNLLQSPTAAEIRRFSPWRSRVIHTTSHSDLSIYNGYAKPSPSPFDYFELNNNDFAYNTYLNIIYRLPVKIPYSFAYNLDPLINPEKVITQNEYHVPVFNNHTTKYNQEILASNGENNTYFIGAYLGHGLHESAAITAQQVANSLSLK